MLAMNQPPPLGLLFVVLLFASLSLRAQTVGETEYGRASYYSDAFQGSETSYGEKYDKNKLTAAHRRFPYNSRVRVTRLDNNRSVVVRIIDEGPLIRGRVVELSKAAAGQLRMTNENTVEVKVELLEIPGQNTVNNGSRSQAGSDSRIRDQQLPRSYNSNVLPPTRDRLPEVVVTTRAPTTQSYGTNNNRGTSGRPSVDYYAPSWERSVESYPQVGKEFQEYGLYKIDIRKPVGGNFGVQVAAVSTYENALSAVANYQARSFDNILVSIEPGPRGKTFRIILGPFLDESSAKRYQRDLRQRYKIKGFTVRLDAQTTPINR